MNFEADCCNAWYNSIEKPVLGLSGKSGGGGSDFPGNNITIDLILVNITIFTLIFAQDRAMA
jgi:hypothetical protein